MKFHGFISANFQVLCFNFMFILAMTIWAQITQTEQTSRAPLSKNKARNVAGLILEIISGELMILECPFDLS